MKKSRKRLIIVIGIPLVIFGLLIVTATIAYKIYTKPGELVIKRSLPTPAEASNKPVLIAVKKRNINSPKESSAVPGTFDLVKAVAKDYYYLINGVYLEKIHKSGRKAGSIFLGYWGNTEVRGIAVDNRENVYIGKADKYFRGELAFYRNFRIEVYDSKGTMIKKLPMPKDAINQLNIVNNKLFLNNYYASFGHYKIYIISLDGKIINSITPPKREFIYQKFYVDQKENIYSFYGYAKGLRIIKINSQGKIIWEKTFQSGRTTDSDIISVPLGIDSQANVYFYALVRGVKEKIVIYKFNQKENKLAKKVFYTDAAKRITFNPDLVTDEGLILYNKTFNKYKLLKIYAFML